jgi:hypothetical protein
MTTLKTLTVVAALLAGGTSLAMAQNGPATGGQRPVAGGANGGGPAYGYVYRYGYGYGLPAPPALVCLLSTLPALQVLALLNKSRP